MAEAVDGELIKKTQETLGKYVTNPTLTSKLLNKPPFKFLHDVINAVSWAELIYKSYIISNKLSYSKD